MALFDLMGKIAIVTGGNGGIGLGMAKGMAECGAAIAVVGRNEEKNALAVAELQAMGVDAMALIVDVTDEAACHKMAADVAERFGGIDILLNNAGINIRKPADELTASEWHQVMDTNLTSALFCSQACYPFMKQRGGGKIINIGSMMSIFAASFTPAYAASKAGIVQLSKACACSWAKDNIQVNAVLPGWIDTALTQRARREVEGLHDRVEARTPAARWGTPADMAGIGAFLAAPASDFVTGTAIPVDGVYSSQG